MIPAMIVTKIIASVKTVPIIMVVFTPKIVRRTRAALSPIRFKYLSHPLNEVVQLANTSQIQVIILGQERYFV